MIRRRPTEVVVMVEPKRCAKCAHLATIHNQLGCCYDQEPCFCLMSRQELEEEVADGS